MSTSGAWKAKRRLQMPVEAEVIWSLRPSCELPSQLGDEIMVIREKTKQ